MSIYWEWVLSYWVFLMGISEKKNIMNVKTFVVFNRSMRMHIVVKWIQPTSKE